MQFIFILFFGRKIFWENLFARKIVGALFTQAFMDMKHLSFLYNYECTTAMRAFNTDWFFALLTSFKSLRADLASELSVSSIIIVKIIMLSATTWTKGIFWYSGE